MNEQNENPDGLIASLYGEEAACEVKEDIRVGDEILNSMPSLEPDAEVIGAIKTDVAAALIARRKRIHRRAVGYRIAVVAALLLIITGLGVRFLAYQGTHYAGAVMAIEDIDTAGFFGTDLQLVLMVDELDEIESSIFSTDQDNGFSDLGADVDDIETEIIEVSSSLW